MFNLAPRGYGRSSYRLAEIIQIGRIPVYLGTQGVLWTPYKGSPYSIASIGYEADETSLVELMEKLSKITAEEVIEKLNRVKAARIHYTLVGVLMQISRFLSDPLGPSGGDLRCSPVPTTPT